MAKEYLTYSAVAITPANSTEYGPTAAATEMICYCSGNWEQVDKHNWNITEELLELAGSSGEDSDEGSEMEGITTPLATDQESIS